MSNLVFFSDPTPPTKHITQLAFWNRLTQPERVGIDLASEPPVRITTDTDATFLAKRQQSAGLRDLKTQVLAAKYIDLDRPDTRAGVQQLEAGGLIGVGRAAIILDSPVQDDERPGV